MHCAVHYNVFSNSNKQQQLHHCIRLIDLLGNLGFAGDSTSFLQSTFYPSSFIKISFQIIMLLHYVSKIVMKIFGSATIENVLSFIIVFVRLQLGPLVWCNSLQKMSIKMLMLASHYSQLVQSRFPAVMLVDFAFQKFQHITFSLSIH